LVTNKHFLTLTDTLRFSVVISWDSYANDCELAALIYNSHICP